jgi:hypothetical protein
MKCWKCGKSEGDSRHTLFFFGYGGEVHLKKCSVCGKTFCQFCMRGECPNCRCLRINKILSRMLVYSSNYKGRIPLDTTKKQGEFSLSRYYEDRDDALQALKELVADNNFDLIYNLEYIRDTESDTTYRGRIYYRTVWSCACVAGHQKRDVRR